MSVEPYRTMECVSINADARDNGAPFLALPLRALQVHKDAALMRGVVLVLPPQERCPWLGAESYTQPPSWQHFPDNPIIGDGGIRTEDLRTEDFRHWCDPCQKGFNSSGAYHAHMDDHIWCTFPGCHFTCRRDKEWKMELHVTSLHNRPDAPDLRDTAKYLDSRRSRFPTSTLVQCKVEELYYRAARGEVLPDERRRWLRQHGVYVSRNIHVPVLREGDEVLDAVRRRNVERRQRTSENALPAEESAVAPPQPSAEPVSSDSKPYVRKPGQKMLPLGPNGKYTRSQLLALVRERYESSYKAPAFYVCNRCGEKGHWVEACPKLADASYAPLVKWGEDRHTSKAHTESSRDLSRCIDAETEPATPFECPADTPPETTASPDHQTLDARSTGDTASPAAVSITRPLIDSRLKAKERSARRAATATSSQPSAAAHRKTSRVVRAALPPPTLYERLTEDQRLNDTGLILQAIRFFVMSNFFADQGADHKSGESAKQCEQQRRPSLVFRAPVAAPPPQDPPSSP